METRISIFSGLSSNLSISFHTSLSSSICGQGTLSAKFIEALGNFVLRGSDKLVIQRRLSSISAEVASHTSGQESVAMYGRYSLSPYPISSASNSSASGWGDILELSRRGLYTDETRRRAINRIMMQLETGDFRPLIEILVRWKPFEVTIFLFELMACLPDERLNAFTSHRSFLHESIRAEYATSSAIRKEQISRAFIRATKLLVLAGKETAESIIKAGFLNAILLIVASEGLQAQAPSSTSVVSTEPSLTLWECKEALVALALYYEEYDKRLEPWPFTLFWPKAKDFNLPLCFLMRLGSTRVALPGPKAPLMSKAWSLRLSSIDALLLSFRPPSGNGQQPYHHVQTALTELLWLLSHSESEPSLQLDATESLMKFIALGPKRWRILGALLVDCSYEVTALVFRKLVSVLLQKSSSESSTILKGYCQLLPSNRRSKPGDYFLEFCTCISRDLGASLIRPLCESGIGFLILTILGDIDPTKSFPPWNLDTDSVLEDPAGRKRLVRDFISNFSLRHDHSCLDSLRILDIGITISVSLSMMEVDANPNIDTDTDYDIDTDADIELDSDTESDIEDTKSDVDTNTDTYIDSELWRNATKNRIRPILFSGLRDVWTLLACQRLSRGDEGAGSEGQADVKRLLICFQALAVLFDVDVYSSAPLSPTATSTI